MPRLALIACCAALLAVLAPSASADPARGAVFSGTGVWVDVWDAGELHPQAVVAEAQLHGIPVIYVESANARSPADVVHPRALRRLVALAHAAGIRVVPWYLPGYDRPAVDRRRLLAAVALGGDGIGVDIEATYVRDPALRARRASRMLAWLRHGNPALPIAAITPNPVHNYWPVFPWYGIRWNADAVLPMCYAPRPQTAAQTAAMVRGCVREPRRRTGHRGFPVHVIAGLAAGLPPRSLLAAAQASLDAGAEGFSLYDLATTTPAGWRALRVFAAG